MQLKNLNPYSGLRQLTSGYICLPRLPILTKIKNKKIKPGELGYFIISLLSADWDTDPERKGSIRHNTSDLSKIWGIPQSTLSGQLLKLVKASQIENKNDVMKFVDFDQYTFMVASQNAKKKLTDEELKQLFPNLLGPTDVSPYNNEISEIHQIKESQSFRDSFKVLLKVDPQAKHPDLLLQENSQNTYTREQWELIRIKDPALPSWQNKLLIDESLRDYSTSYYEGYSHT
jgi:hypothetical protein